METYYINGYRIAARSYGQAIESARQLRRGEYPFNWPGERSSPGFWVGTGHPILPDYELTRARAS